MSNEHELTDDQQILADRMSDVSEDCYSAGWMIDLEYHLWELIYSDPPRKYGIGPVSDQDVRIFKSLSERIGGWICYRSDITDKDLPQSEWGEVFVPLERWLEMYNKWIEHRSKWHGLKT